MGKSHQLRVKCTDKIINQQPIHHEPYRVKPTGCDWAQCQYRYRLARGLTCSKYETVEPPAGTVPHSGCLCGRSGGPRGKGHSQNYLSLWKELRSSVRNQSDFLFKSLSTELCTPRTCTFRTQHGPPETGQLLRIIVRCY